MSEKLPSIDIVIIMSDMWMLPYLKNTCNALSRQNYPREKFEILVSFLYEKKEDISELAKYCHEIEATIIFRKSTSPAFNDSKAYNNGIRRSSRSYVMSLNCDVVLHPDTFIKSSEFLNENTVVQIPVGRMKDGPKSDIFNTTDDIEWRRLTKSACFQRDGVGNIIAPRVIVNKLRGFDERLYGWGGSDTDFENRLRLFKFNIVNLIDHDFPLAMHQWHAPCPTCESEFTRRNRNIIATTHHRRRNEAEWGGVPNE
jgi:hypothetical protein